MSEILVIDLLQNINTLSKFILSKWILIGLFSLAGGLAGITYIWMQEPRYTAEISFVSENEKSGGLGGYAGIAAQFGFDIGFGGGGAFEGENLMGLLKSRKLIDKTLLSKLNGSNLLLIDEYLTNHNLKANLTKASNSTSINFDATKGANTRIEDSIINVVANEIIKNQLSIDKPEKKQDIVYIRFKDNNELFAKQFVEVLTNNAITFYSAYKSKRSSENVRILEHQADSVRNMLFGNITDVASINDLNVNPVKQNGKTGSQKKQIDIQVNSLLYGELVKNLELAKLTLRKETPLIQIIDTPNLPLKNEKMGRLFGGLVAGILSFLITIIYLFIKHSLTQIQTKKIF